MLLEDFLYLKQMKMKKQKNEIEHLDLTVNEIEEILDCCTITDTIVDNIIKKYEKMIAENDDFSKIKDIINFLDLTKYDEEIIGAKLNEAAKRSFCSLMIAGKLSIIEIVYFVKHNFALDSDIERIFNAMVVSEDFVNVVVHWRPVLFDTVLKQYKEKYKISNNMIEKAKNRTLNLEKFKFLNS
jgi:hypothetical protein